MLHKIAVTHEAGATEWRCTCGLVRRRDANGFHRIHPSCEPWYQHDFGEGGLEFGRVTATTINYDELAEAISEATND